MRSEIDWAKSWVVADILTRRSRISKPNFPRSCPDLAWCSVEQSHCHTVTLWLQVNNWSIPARSPWFCQTVMSGRSDNEVFLGSGSPGRLLTLWMIWWSLAWSILLFLLLITDWRGYEQSRNVTDGTNGQSVLGTSQYNLALATIIHLYCSLVPSNTLLDPPPPYVLSAYFSIILNTPLICLFPLQ